MRTRDDMDTDKLTDAPRGCGSGVGCSLYRGDVATNNGRYKTGTDLFISDELHIRSFDHRVGCLDHGDEALALDHS